MSGIQTPKESAQEAVVNTGSAFVISWMSHFLIIAPLVKFFDADYGGVITAFWITLFYTVLALARNYTIRRIYVRKSLT